MFRTSILSAAILSTALAFISTTAAAADLQVEIVGVSAQTGHVGAVLLGSAAAWNGEEKASGYARSAPDGDDTLELTFADLQPGQYAVRVMHDENGNGELDKNIVGMPTEGYGFSNNPRVMRPAKYEEARFDVPAGGTKIRIVLR